MSVQYTRGCSVHRVGYVSTVGGIREYSGRGGGVFSTLGLTMMSVGDIMSTLGGVQYTGDIVSILGGWGCAVHQGIIMSTLGDTKMHVGGYHEYSTLDGYHEYTRGIP